MPYYRNKRRKGDHMKTVKLRSKDTRSGWKTGAVVVVTLTEDSIIHHIGYGYNEIKMPISNMKYFEEVRDDSRH
jgi:hypothetical protein